MMKIGDLVKHRLHGVGVIIDIDADYKVARGNGEYEYATDHRVMHANGSLFWADSRLLEVISESR
jgi:heat shock protein HspQ